MDLREIQFGMQLREFLQDRKPRLVYLLPRLQRAPFSVMTAHESSRAFSFNIAILALTLTFRWVDLSQRFPQVVGEGHLEKQHRPRDRLCWAWSMKWTGGTA